jgi:arylsulfatase A-like enzyme
MTLPSWAATKRLPSSLAPLLVLYVTCVVRFHIRDELQVQALMPSNIAVLMSGLLSLFLIAWMVDILVPQVSILKFLAGACLVTGYVVLSTYHLRSHVLLDYAVIAENTSLAFHKESMELISQIPRRDDYLLWVGFILAVGVLEWKWSGRPLVPFNNKWRLLLALLGVYALCIQLLPYSYDEVTSFAQSAYRYYFPPKSLFSVPNPSERYPYSADLVSQKRDDPPQHVFLIMVESFNANFPLHKTPEGKPYTPFFDALTSQGLFFDNFFGNSMQTPKGQLSVLASIPDLSSGKVFTDCHELSLHCLPQVLKENGFETLYFQGQTSLDFDNTGRFMKRNGFDHVHSINEDFLSAEQLARYKWGWGVQDNILYQKAFEYLDHVSSTNRSSGKKERYFVLLATISNHAKFKSVPPTQRYLYPEQRTKKQQYANSIRVTDEYLKTFFAELRQRDYLSNSIVIITGDHSFPVGEHGYYDNESGFYNEYFKTPLLIWGKGITSGTSHEIHSQLDIAPTVLELLGISARVHFTGRSLFAGADTSVPLVQPYAGNCLGVICFPYKYVYRNRGHEEYVFDLGKDPLERTNLIKGLINSPMYTSFHHAVANILLNDRLLRENRIWPTSVPLSPSPVVQPR